MRENVRFWEDPHPSLFGPRLNPVWRKAIRNAVRSARGRAGKTAKEFRDVEEWALQRMIDQDGRCEVSNWPFSLEKHGSGQAPYPYKPSLDRIDPQQGYVVGNLRLVCWCVNTAMNTWGVDVYLDVAESALRHHARL